MKTYIKNVPWQFARTYTVMLVCFTAIGCAKGMEMVPMARLAELLLLAVVGGFLMEAAFGKCIFKKMTYTKRMCVFVIPFATATCACASVFGWSDGMEHIGDYIRLGALFAACGILSVVLCEIEHWIRGREYTWKLKAYQNREEKNGESE